MGRGEGFALTPSMTRELLRHATLSLRGFRAIPRQPSFGALVRRGLLSREEGASNSHLTTEGWKAVAELLPPDEAEHATMLATGAFRIGNPKRWVVECGAKAG